MAQTNPRLNPGMAALAGGLFGLPLFVANAIVAQRIEPFFSMIRPGPHTSTFELVLLAGVLACLPLGACLAARPLLDPKARRASTWLVNGTMSVLLLVAFVLVSAGLGADIYRCDVLRIPNCD